MKFSINSLFLWPKNSSFSCRRVQFCPNSVNILTGASRTGKSAIIPIIDYCLGAKYCTIPVGTIRDTCSWFGILVDLEDEQLLLCRKEPGHHKSTGEMYLSRAKQIVIPNTIDKSNVTVLQVKNLLNELFGFSFLETGDLGANNFASHPSYRDTMAFLFQPQNVIANNRVLFYNIEKMEHKSKLITIFPYILGAITAETLSNMQERDRLKRLRDKTQRELTNIKNVSIRWQQEVRTWISLSKEYGLTDFAPNDSTTFDEMVDELKHIAEKKLENMAAPSNLSDELVELRCQERDLSEKLFTAKKRFEAMETLKSSERQYERSLETQRSRLNISTWLRSLTNDNGICPICGKPHSDSDSELDELCRAIAEIEQQADIVKEVNPSFDREFNIVKAEIEEYNEQLTALHKRIKAESLRRQVNASEKYTLENISRFLGRLEFALQTYEQMGHDSALENELEVLNDQISKLDKALSNTARSAKEKAALAFIQQEANEIIKQLDVEHPNDPLEFDKTNLTIKIRMANGRETYLWEIGSASNWLSYHIAISLAFQKFFQERANIQIPNILVFDQPSQVYFPQKGLEEGSTAKQDADLLRDEDKAAIKKLFKALSAYIENAKSELQIIVMEHADEDIWGGFKNITLVARWRDGEKLIPTEWITQ